MTPTTYRRDARGLHPLDSGQVFAVRFTTLGSGKVKREWLKTEAGAINRADWHRSIGRPAVVLRYTIADESEVAR